MALPADVSTFTLTFGAYTDAVGTPVFGGMKGRITPSSQVRHIESGRVIAQSPINFVIGEDGTAQIPGLAHTDLPVLSPHGFTYTVEWPGTTTYTPNPGRKRFAVPAGMGATADFDLLEPAPDVPGILVPVIEGAAGREIELGRSATHVQWRYAGDTAWVDLVPLTDITGPAGPAGTGGGTGGTDGREVLLRRSGTHVQWQYEGDTVWLDLVPLVDLTGPQGPAGPVGPEGPQGAVGPQGDTGATGPQGSAGTDGESAYEVAVAGGFVGTEADWLASLVGPEGPAGDPGPAGPAGPEGPQGAQGIAGPDGPAGPKGDAGPAGPGVPVGGTTGQVLAKTGEADYATGWTSPSGGADAATLGPLFSATPQIGEWLHIPINGTASGTYGSAGALLLGELYLPAGTYDQVAFNVVSAGSAGSVTKVMAYAADGTGKPGGLLLETAAVDASTSGDKVIAGLDLVSPPGGRKVWVGLVTQGDPATLPAYRNVFALATAVVRSSFGATSNSAQAWRINAVTGAAPTTAVDAVRDYSYGRLAFRRSA